MIKQVCICDRCGKQVDDSIFAVTIYGTTLNSRFGLSNAEVMAQNIKENLRPTIHLCLDCKNMVEEFINNYNEEDNE